MTEHGFERGFIQYSRAYYANSIPSEEGIQDRISIGLYAEEGGTAGEFMVVWKDLGGSCSPRLDAFDDAWAALKAFPDLLDAMADIDGKNVSPDEFREILISLGIKDFTPTEPEEKYERKVRIMIEVSEEAARKVQRGSTWAVLV